MARSLEGNWRDEHLHELASALRHFDFLDEEIRRLEELIEQEAKRLVSRPEENDANPLRTTTPTRVPELLTKYPRYDNPIARNATENDNSITCLANASATRHHKKSSRRFKHKDHRNANPKQTKTTKTRYHSQLKMKPQTWNRNQHPATETKSSNALPFLQYLRNLRVP